MTNGQLFNFKDFHEKVGCFMAIIVDKENKRKNIAMSCKDLIFQNGITNLTVSQVTNYAKIGKGTLYSYFKNKEEIVFEIVNLLMVEHNEKLIKKLDNLTSTKDKLKQFATFFYSDEDVELRELYKEFISIFLINQREYISKFKVKCFNNYSGLFYDIVKKAVENNELKQEALTLCPGMLLTAEGLFISKLMRNDIEDLKYEIDNYFDIILNLLATGK